MGPTLLVRPSRASREAVGSPASTAKKLMEQQGLQHSPDLLFHFLSSPFPFPSFSSPFPPLLPSFPDSGKSKFLSRFIKPKPKKSLEPEQQEQERTPPN